MQAFEMRVLRQILHVSWTAKGTNDWVMDKAIECQGIFSGISEGLDVIVFWTYHEKEVLESLEKQIMQGTSPGSHTRGRPKTTFFNGLDTHWTRHSCILKSEDRVKWRQLVHGVGWLWPSLETRMSEGKAKYHTALWLSGSVINIVGHKRKYHATFEPCCNL